MKYFLSIAVILALLIACKKEKFETRPLLQLESTSSREVPKNGGLEVNFRYTDKQGDVDTIYYVRQRLNRRGAVTQRPIGLKLPIPSSVPSATIELNLTYNFHLTLGLPPIGTATNLEKDTLVFSFVLLDKEKNKSDTVVIDNVIVTR